MIAILLATTLASFKEPRFSVQVTPDIVYSTAPVRAPAVCDLDLMLDVYEPDGANAPSTRPAIVLLHGGGFTRGSRAGIDSFSSLCEELASRGYVCASITYRLEGDDPVAPGATLRDRTITAAAEDALSAIRYLIRNSARYQIDPRRIGLGGRSAGAGIALEAAYSPAGRTLPIRAVLDVSGSKNRNLEALQKGDPPLCIIHGTNDTLVPVAAAYALAKRAAEVGIPYETYFREGKRAGHIQYLTLEINGVTLLESVVAFFNKYL